MVFCLEADEEPEFIIEAISLLLTPARAFGDSILNCLWSTLVILRYFFLRVSSFFFRCFTIVLAPESSFEVTI